MGHGAVDIIIEARKEGPFKSLWDFLRRVDLSVMNRAVVENLIKAGAFDEIEPNRALLIAALPDYIAAVQRLSTKGDQLSLFELMDNSGSEDAEPELPDVADFPVHERLECEKEVTGLYISGHPFDTYEEELSKFTNCFIADLPLWMGKVKPQVGGILLSVSEKTTKKGDAMGVMLLEDSESSIPLVAFPKTWDKIKDRALSGSVCVVEGKIDDRGQVIVDDLTPLDDLKGQEPRLVNVTLRVNMIPALNVKELARALRDCRGPSPVLLGLRDDRESCAVYLDSCRVMPSPDRVRECLTSVVPEEALEVSFGPMGQD